MNGSQVSRQRSEYWSEWVRKWQAVGGTKKAFCRQHGLPLYSFYDWSRRLCPSQAVAGAQFAQVHCTGGTGLQIRLGAHAILHIEPDFDVKTLRRLLAALGSAAC